ncbi:MAG TPA: NAD-dependent malic enzyme [Xanthobacteraceae bacterium]|nr:NAD-dependent malic enzyme [Xanthobacteraceae bacterium]
MHDKSQVVETALSGYELLNDPLWNKGTAFTDAERDEFDLHGLLPPYVMSLDLQVDRRLEAFRTIDVDLYKYIFLRGTQDTNETLFYALLARHIEEMMPIVYTPTVGLGCQQFSRIFRKPRGLFLSFPLQDRIGRILANRRFDGVEAIVVSDGERILGLGDQGAGGMGIPIGKLALYTACAGLPPSTTLPILLDVGTDNRELLHDPLYIGWRHERVRGAAYDDFVAAFVAAVRARWPHVLLHWEDFALNNANRLLARYRDQLCSFNDDIQGTAAIAVGTILSAINVTGVPLAEQRVAVLGAGSAGTGICALLARAMTEAGLSEREARGRFYLVDRDGLLLEGTAGLQPFQAPFAQSRERIAAWKLPPAARIGLAEVVANARPTVLIGTSGQASAFTEPVVKTMAAHVPRPVIFPLSNPTQRSEATPEQLLAWTEGRAVIGTGSPFPPVTRDGDRFRVDQTNNAYVYPGVGLGAIAVEASRISDGMFLAAARAIADLSPTRRDTRANLLPPLAEIRKVSLHVAIAVAQAAVGEGLAHPPPDGDLAGLVGGKMWEPVYATYRRLTGKPPGAS